MGRALTRMIWGWRLWLAACVLLGAMTLAPRSALADCSDIPEGCYYEGLHEAYMRGDSLVPKAPSSSGDTSAEVIKKILKTFHDGAKKWEEKFAAFATSLFWILVSIELSWTAINMALRGSDLGEWLQELVSQVFFVGFFWFLLFNASTILPAIVHSFTGAADQLGKAQGADLGGGDTTLGGVNPAAVYKKGYDLAWSLVEHMSGWKPITAVFLGISSLVVMVITATLTGQLIIALVESYIYMSMSVFFLGFGGSRWTKDYASKMLNLAVSIGVKLFVMELLIVLAFTIINGYNLDGACDTGGVVGSKDCSLITKTIQLVATLLVIWLLIKSLPTLTQSILSGVAGTSGAEAYVASKMPSPAMVAKLTLGIGYEVAATAWQAISMSNEYKKQGRSRLNVLGDLLGEAWQTTGDRLSARRRNPDDRRWSGHYLGHMGQRKRDLKAKRTTGKAGSERNPG